MLFEDLNKRFLFKPKLLYFTFSLVVYTIHQYKSQFLMHMNNISKKELSISLPVVQLIAFTFGLTIAFLNDRYGKVKNTLVLLLITCFLTFMSFFMIQNNKVLFWSTYTTYFSSISSLVPLLDSFVLNYLTNTPGFSVSSYGLQRLWGSIGYIVTNFIIDQITVVTKEKKDFTNLKVYSMLVTSLSIFFVQLFVKNSNPNLNQTSIFSSVGILLKNKEFMYFIFIILLCGITRCSMTTYLSIFYTDVLKFENVKSGFDIPQPFLAITDFFYTHKQATAGMFANFFEIVIFFYSKKIIQKYGLFMPLFIAQFAQLARFFLYRIFPIESEYSFMYVCGIELLKGINFSLIQCSAAVLVTKIVSPNYKTSAQLLYNGTFIALGSIFSGIIFSQIFGENKSTNEFNLLFTLNIIMSLMIIGFFILRYVLMDNILFNRSKEEALLSRNIDEDLIDEKMEKAEIGNVVKEAAN